MQKLIFFDIDGTLWDDDMVIPESTKEAVRRLKENGHKSFLCSGRSRSTINAEELLALGFDGIIAACGNYIERDGEVIYDALLAEEVVKKSIRVLKECGMPVVLEGPVDCWIDQKGFENDPYVDYLYESLQEHARPLIGYEPDIRINKFSADILADTDWERVQAELGETFDFLIHVGDVVEFVPKGTSKATGIQWLCEHLHVAHEDTYAVGDSVNDLDMLEFVAHGIAMGNGSERAKAASEFVTADIHEDGILKAMEHYGLI